MPSRSEALEILRRELGAFVRAHELRLLHVERPDDAHGEVVNLARAMECHADARGPVVVLDDAFLGPGGGWTERVERLRGEHAKRVEAVPGLLGPFVWSDEHRERDPVARFGAAARAFADTLPKGSPVLTLVLAPTRIEDAGRYRHELAAVLERVELRDVRFIVADRGEAGSVAALLGTQARRYVVAIDELDMDALARTITYGPDGAPSLARFGRAGPKVALPNPSGDAHSARFAAVEPPVRRGQFEAPPASPASSRAKAAAIEAAAAAQRSRMVDAYTVQVQAVDEAARATPEEMVAHQMCLAGYALGAGHPETAVECFEVAARWAGGAGLLAQEAQALLAIGAIHEATSRHGDAAAAFGLAGRLAEQGESPVLAVGAWQSAALHAERLDNLPEAAGAYGHAIRIASADPSVAEAVDLPAIRRRLAAVLERVEFAEHASAIRDSRAPQPEASE